MKQIVPAVFLALMMSTYAFAAPAADMSKPPVESGKKLSKQQMRMKDCNREAKEKKLKGAERKSFMKSCLSGKH